MFDLLIFGVSTMRLAIVSLAILALSVPTAHADDSSWKVAFAPLPEVADSQENPITPGKVTLGKKLYLDTRLSKDETISCNSCHNLKTFGVDNEPTSPGHKGQRGGRNSPTSFNAALHSTQFWDGRAATVEKQALGPILNPIEMAMPSEAVVIERLKNDPGYSKGFAAAFPGDTDPISFANIGNAIGAFERTLITPSRFDKFLKGDDNAITFEEKKGAQAFVQTGCIACHNGATLGGMMFQRLGLVKPYPTQDMGRFEITKSEADKMMFKVPSLRNVTKTGPYFHDGSIKSLNEAVSKMAEYQLGKQLTPDQVKEIVTFLDSLTATDTSKFL
jgi:cytochrome c peroxidase